jgi:hypothetical protein
VPPPPGLGLGGGVPVDDERYLLDEKWQKANPQPKLHPSFAMKIGCLLVTLPLLSEAWQSTENSRRSFLITSGSLLVPTVSQAAATRAVGSGEVKCKEDGNCLEIGEWDGAVGWNWGGKDRCDATDPLCGPDGTLRDEIVGKAIPIPAGDITYAVAITIDVGRQETGLIRLGLYGNDCSASVEQLVAFFSTGLSTLSNNDNSLGQITSPVRLLTGGIVDSITPGLTVDFGVPSQQTAYGRARGLSKVSDYRAQPRPDPTFVSQDKMVRSHDAAGLLSVSQKGLGYGGTGFEQDDEAFESSFLITSSAVPALDKNRRVIGQVLDSQSMAFLERLANLTTKKGLKGVIPGQTTGPPLLKVVVRDVVVSKVSAPPPS